jgi:hypothetical protein
MVATNTFVSELQKRINNVAKVLTDTRITAKYTLGKYTLGKYTLRQICVWK